MSAVLLLVAQLASYIVTDGVKYACATWVGCYLACDNWTE